jgi:hypothetical protein
MRIRLGGALVGFAVAGGGSGLGAARGMPLRPGHHDASGAPAALPLSGRTEWPAACCPRALGPWAPWPRKRARSGGEGALFNAAGAGPGEPRPPVATTAGGRAGPRVPESTRPGSVIDSRY